MYIYAYIYTHTYTHICTYIYVYMSMHTYTSHRLACKTSHQIAHMQNGNPTLHQIPQTPHFCQTQEAGSHLWFLINLCPFCHHIIWHLPLNHLCSCFFLSICSATDVTYASAPHPLSEWPLFCLVSLPHSPFWVLKLPLSLFIHLVPFFVPYGKWD